VSGKDTASPRSSDEYRRPIGAAKDIDGYVEAGFDCG
jgi:hypothetical protein